MLADPNIQFVLRTPPPPQPPPAWLRAFGKWLGNAFRPIGDFLAAIGRLMPEAPYARIFMWGILIAAAIFLLWLLWVRLREGNWRLPRLSSRTSVVAEAPEEEWQPEAAPARAWLEEADTLAGQGLYAEAAHHLLIRSIEDLGRRRPGLVRPALTSRDLSASTAVPPRARALFTDIAQVVERSLFGGRGVSRDDWSACGQAYSDFAQARTWALKGGAPETMATA